MSEAADGQRVWDGHQFRVVLRCPHGRIRKDLCKPCGGAGICQHNRRRNGGGGTTMCVVTCFVITFLSNDPVEGDRRKDNGYQRLQNLLLVTPDIIICANR